ncbi:hypothetical protein [Pantoea piersonii]|uniref:hypothetical protein n=1 Tax=Pantoea piersonii TaxID=2364647 RepID=UPI0022F18708|nr:hypothetical protein [Pantoea piersonii]WBV23906.1 hypothetical protein PG877_19715 [Pantoea piersonii]
MFTDAVCNRERRLWLTPASVSAQSPVAGSAAERRQIAKGGGNANPQCMLFTLIIRVSLCEQGVMDASDVNDLLTDFENQTIHNMENMFKENIYIRRVGVYHTGSGIEGLNKLALLHDKKDADNGHQDNTCSRPQPVTAEKAELFFC